MHQETVESYVDCKKKLYSTIIDYLDESEEIFQQSFSQFCENMRNYNIEEDREEMTQFLQILKSISNHHHRDENFNQKIKEILQHYKKSIKQTLSNDEIFQIFENNKLIIYFFFQNGIINISESIYQNMNKFEPNGNRYCHFFYPELEQFIGEEEMKSTKKEILAHNPTAFEQFEEKRQEGENESHICSLIRKDLVEEFIAYINRHNISVCSEIKPSIFETNSFLIENKSITLIQYSAFFGSIQIFRFLLMNNAELTPSLWLYSIHSKNAELIHLLESNKIKPPRLMTNKNFNIKDESYIRCLIESIKCHHKDFSEYFENNFIQEKEIESPQIKEEILFNIIKYYNYSYFQINLIKEKGFFYLCLCNYQELVELLLKEKEDEIKNKIKKMIPTIKIQ